MPQFHKGNGGSVSFAAFNMDVTTWNLSLKNRIAETTSSKTNGLARWQATVDEGDFSCEILWDSEAIPDTDLGLVRGGTGTFVFYVGDSNKFYAFPGILESITVKVNNLSDVVKCDLSGKVNGTLILPSS